MSGKNRSTTISPPIAAAAFVRIHYRLHTIAHRHLSTDEELKRGRRAVWAAASFFAAGAGASSVYGAARALGAGETNAWRITLAVFLTVFLGLSIWPLVEPGTFRPRWVLGSTAGAMLLFLALSTLFI
ncbi:hypothetical protein [Kitasatospora sp. GP82]|uniref:hypothetical protein n=1 Tax=Kitasatospora sp. GP82 TaxID=3035089 RepID=UPI002473EB1E|nr:hypothetical protein [Kitasatospora sp. GP82]MDH6129363.1 hypothetical protein [Kitasatospora sp. GP82]